MMDWIYAGLMVVFVAISWALVAGLERLRPGIQTATHTAPAGKAQSPQGDGA